MNTKHTKGSWIVLADPEHKGKHPLHDNRYIATGNASWEYCAYHPDGFYLDNGSIICALSDQECQAGDARLIAAAPDLLAFVREISETGRGYVGTETTDLWILKARELTRELPVPAED